MKLRQILLILIGFFSILSGYLMSKASLVGRAGMSLFYREYNFLKSWWKGALVVFIALVILFALQGLLQKRLAKPKTAQLIILVFAAVGLYFTYNDFRHTLSHHLLGERFHLGVYLFWISWMLISLYYFFLPKQELYLREQNP
jgi:hypothetical protein